MSQQIGGTITDQLPTLRCCTLLRWGFSRSQLTDVAKTAHLPTFKRPRRCSTLLRWGSSWAVAAGSASRRAISLCWTNMRSMVPKAAAVMKAS